MTRIGQVFRPRLESLEDRALPATFAVTTTLDVVDPADGKRSLREAVTAANARDGEDVIILPEDVIIDNRAGVNEDGNATGDFDIADTVTIRGAGRSRTFIDGQQLDRVFHVIGTTPGSIRLVLEGLTVRGGKVIGGGGGILAADADLVVRDCTIVGNQSTSAGGGISNLNGTGFIKLVRTTVARNVAGANANGGGVFVLSPGELTIVDGSIRRNYSAGAGGGIYAPTATLTHTTIAENVAGAFGGGVRTNSVTLTRCTIRGNVAASLGGGLFAPTQVTLTSSTVSGNSSFTGDGGGILAGAANVTNCTISGNSAAGNGGGMNAATATLTNATVSGNLSRTDGGGVYATTATMLNCTVVENIAVHGGGLFHNTGGTFSVRNTIVALNLVDVSGFGPDVAGGPFTSQGHNLIGDSSGGTGFTNGVNGDIVGTSADPIDPKLGPLQNNGGPTKTMALLAGSPAIDRGDNTILPATDQRGAGFPRKKDGNGDGLAIVDIGAFER